MGNWGKQLWKRKCRCNLRRTWTCKAKTKNRKSNERTENELWQEYYAPYLHFLSFSEIYSRLETSPSEGLTEEVATTKLKRNGKNTLPIPPKPHLLLVRYLCYCFSVIGVILLLSAFVCFFLHYYAIITQPKKMHNPKYLLAGWILLIIFFLAGLMPVLHEEDNTALLESIDETMPMFCTVIREGNKEIILTQDVVIGDIVPISYGQRLPADLRFITTSGLEVDNVALTGSSEPWQIFPLASDEKQIFSQSKVVYLNE